MRDGRSNLVEAVRPAGGLLIGHALDGAGELAAGEAKMEDQRCFMVGPWCTGFGHVEPPRLL